ncbi:Serine--tRNA ligase, cytoplasmic [Oopsacas minuta]|uniref:serine--tRNA ligase n=1 Tax=Oopsacas minuta TaxID=111878 RepID=A0AAV7J9E4_9METZ|nr:Serine--tRNA ligase, cytoplasmic [Oopsacas minuta]
MATNINIPDIPSLEFDLLRADKGGKPELVRENQKKRFKSVEGVDKIIELDTLWRKLRFSGDNWNKVKRIVCTQIGDLMKTKGPMGEEGDQIPEDIILKLSELNKELVSVLNVTVLKKLVAKVELEMKSNNEKLMETEREREVLFSELGNLLHPDVIISDDEENNKIERTFGDCSVRYKHSHVDLIEMIDAVDLHRGSLVSGSRCYYLKGPGVFLEQALIQLALRELGDKGFEVISTPFFMKKGVMQQVAQLSQFDEELYKVVGKRSEVKEDVEIEEKYLIATSEQTIAAFHRDEWLPTKSLPIRYAGISTCFRQEVGSHGRDMLGIFRVHQFNKIEQFCITSPNESWTMFHEMIGNAESFYKLLGIPYRVVNIVSGELNNAAAMKYDLEAWFPSSGKFRELVSCSNCTDWQSRRLLIRYGQKKLNEAATYVHMLNATMCATTRTICAILENYQTEAGIKVPEALQPFMPTKFREYIPYVAKEISTNQEAAVKKKGGKVK